MNFHSFEGMWDPKIFYVNAVPTLYSSLTLNGLLLFLLVAVALFLLSECIHFQKKKPS